MHRRLGVPALALPAEALGPSTSAPDSSARVDSSDQHDDHADRDGGEHARGALRQPQPQPGGADPGRGQP